MQGATPKAVKLGAELKAIGELCLLDVPQATENVNQDMRRALRDIKLPAEFRNVPAAARRVEEFKDCEGPLNRICGGRTGLHVLFTRRSHANRVASWWHCGCRHSSERRRQQAAIISPSVQHTGRKFAVT